jgi:hypothetical protein
VVPVVRDPVRCVEEGLLDVEVAGAPFVEVVLRGIQVIVGLVAVGTTWPLQPDRIEEMADFSAWVTHSL